MAGKWVDLLNEVAPRRSKFTFLFNPDTAPYAPKFQKAIRENRVMTITLPTVGTKKDFGVVGFEREKNAAFLIFPNSLKKFAGKRIVGIKYSLLAAAKAEGKPVKAVAPKPQVRRVRRRLVLQPSSPPRLPPAH